MSLVISTGSNLEDRVNNLSLAKEKLTNEFQLIEESRIYESPAVDYENQPDFLNQILVFELPKLSPIEVLSKTMEIEKELGRTREIDKGPRTVDIDLLFWEKERINHPDLTIPHYALFERSFIVLPLMELDVYKFLSKEFNFPTTFNNQAFPIDPRTLTQL